MRRIVYLLVFALLVSAGGVAPSQTLSAYLTYDAVAHDTAPLKASHKEQLEAAYSVANRHAVSAVRQEQLTYAAQCCMHITGRLHPPPPAGAYQPLSLTFARHYPEILSPPPRTVLPA